jgi:hypothetical protein
VLFGAILRRRLRLVACFGGVASAETLGRNLGQQPWAETSGRNLGRTGASALLRRVIGVEAHVFGGQAARKERVGIHFRFGAFGRAKRNLDIDM